MGPVTLVGVRKGQSEFRERLLPQAHFLERQFVHPTLSWDKGCETLAVYDGLYDLSLLATTHTAGQSPPGNGPFYVPDWALASSAESETGDIARDIVNGLKRLGFRSVVAHAIVLSETNDYLVDAMRVAQTFPWNVDPLLYRCYLYPGMTARWRQPLRQYTTTRWTPNGLATVEIDSTRQH